jgi:hypothetical protein
MFITLQQNSLINAPLGNEVDSIDAQTAQSGYVCLHSKEEAP